MSSSNHKRPKHFAIPTTRSTLVHVALMLSLVIGGIVSSVYFIWLSIPHWISIPQLIEQFENSNVISSASFFGLSSLLGGIGVGFLTLLTAVAVGGPAWGQFSKARKLDLNGTITEGIITALWTRRLDEVYYYATYQYGGGFKAAARVERQRFKHLYVGYTVAVRLLPDSPFISRPEWDWTSGIKQPDLLVKSRTRSWSSLTDPNKLESQTSLTRKISENQERETKSLQRTYFVVMGVMFLCLLLGALAFFLYLYAMGQGAG